MSQLHSSGNLKLLDQTNSRFAFISNQELTNYEQKFVKVFTNDGLNHHYTLITDLTDGANKLAFLLACKTNHPVISVLPCQLDHMYPIQNDYLKSLTYIKHGVVISDEENVNVDVENIVDQQALIVKLATKVIFIHPKINPRLKYLVKLATQYHTKLFALTTNQRPDNQILQNLGLTLL